jgi:hypothetical protein
MNETPKQYNMTISTNKTKVLAFGGKVSRRAKLAENKRLNEY